MKFTILKQIKYCNVYLYPLFVPRDATLDVIFCRTGVVIGEFRD
jgi:hypothetical protein